MRAIDTVTGHFDGSARQSLVVPAWKDADGKPLEVYWRLLTMEQRKKILDSAADDVDIIVAMAQNKDGEPLFGKEDKPLLRLRADAAIILALARKMWGGDRNTDELVEQAAKN